MALLDTVNEETTQYYTVTLEDENNVALPLVDIATLTLTYYNIADGSIINSRNGQNVLNANNVTFHATSGLLTWVLQPADTVIVNGNLLIEYHGILLVFTLTNGHVGRHRDILPVLNMDKVP